MRVASLLNLSDEAMPSIIIDDLIDAACGCLDQFCERNMPDSIEKTLLEKAFKDGDHGMSRLQALVERFEKSHST